MKGGGEEEEGVGGGEGGEEVGGDEEGEALAGGEEEGRCRDWGGGVVQLQNPSPSSRAAIAATFRPELHLFSFPAAAASRKPVLGLLSNLSVHNGRANGAERSVKNQTKSLKTKPK